MPDYVDWSLDWGIPSCRVDDAFLKMFTSSNSSSDDDSNEHGDNKVDTGLEISGDCLCPNPENFECSTDTAFSEAALLQL